MPSEPFPYQRIVGKYSEDRLAKFIRFQSRIRSLYNLWLNNEKWFFHCLFAPLGMEWLSCFCCYLVSLQGLKLSALIKTYVPRGGGGDYFQEGELSLPRKKKPCTVLEEHDMCLIGVSRSEPRINHSYEKIAVLMYVCIYVWPNTLSTCSSCKQI